MLLMHNRSCDCSHESLSCTGKELGKNHLVEGVSKKFS